MKKFSKKIPVYGGILTLIISEDPKAIRQEGVNFDYDTVYAHTIPGQSKSGATTYFVVLNDKYPRLKLNHGVVAHECFHVSCMLLDYVGVLPSFENDEAQAYLLGWITNCVYDWIKKAKVELK